MSNQNVWPLQTAGGESFNSIDEMLKSDNSYIRGLARSIIRLSEDREKIAAGVFNEMTKEM